MSSLQKEIWICSNGWRPYCPYSPIPTSRQANGTTTPDNLQMLCHSCNLDKSNKPFDKDAEDRGLQGIYAMSDADVDALPEGGK